MSRTITQLPIKFSSDYTNSFYKCNSSQCNIVKGQPTLLNLSGVVVLSLATTPLIESNLNVANNFQQTYLLDPANILFGKKK